jgi:hypothetical protein
MVGIGHDQVGRSKTRRPRAFLLSATLGRDGEAEAYFAHAVETHERIGTPWSLAMTQLSWGRFLSTRGDTADLDRASSLLEQAPDTAQ